jgi:hypothetical protein
LVVEVVARGRAAPAEVVVVMVTTTFFSGESEGAASRGGGKTGARARGGEEARGEARREGAGEVAPVVDAHEDDEGADEEGPEEAASRAMAAAARRCEWTVSSRLSVVRSTNVDAMGEDMSSREGSWCVGRVENFEERWRDVCVRLESRGPRRQIEH